MAIKLEYRNNVARFLKQPLHKQSYTQHKYHCHNRLQANQTSRTHNHRSPRHEQSIIYSQHTLTHINDIKQTSHTNTKLSISSQTTLKNAKLTLHSKAKHQHSANSKLVFHKAAYYHIHYSTYTHQKCKQHKPNKTIFFPKTHIKHLDNTTICINIQSNIHTQSTQLDNMEETKENDTRYI